LLHMFFFGCSSGHLIIVEHNGEPPLLHPSTSSTTAHPTSTVAPLHHYNTSAMIVPASPAFIWDASWWLTSEPDDDFPSILQSSGLCFMAPMPLLQTDTRHGIPSSCKPLQPRWRTRRRTHRCLCCCCFLLVSGPLCNSGLLRGPS
jgi:hypothetical protein